MANHKYEWDQYNGTTDAVLKNLLAEEIEQMERSRGKTFSGSAAKADLKSEVKRALIFWTQPFLHLHGELPSHLQKVWLQPYREPHMILDWI